MRNSLLLMLLLGTAPCSGQRPETVQQLAAAGQMAQAEALAHAGGPDSLAVLGEVLMLRGRLDEAESTFRSAITHAAGSNRARAGLAEVLHYRNRTSAAYAVADSVAAAWTIDHSDWTAVELLAAARVWRLLGNRDPSAVHTALQAYDAVTLADSTSISGRLGAASLFLERYNAPDAATEYQAILSVSPGNADALLGLAQVEAFRNSDPLPLIEQALSRNPSLAAAEILRARVELEAESYDSATAAAGRALSIDPSAIEAWAQVGAIAWLLDDSSGFRSAERVADSISPGAPRFLAMVAEAAGRHRRYAAAVEFASRAVARDSFSVLALGALGTNLMRTGRLDEARPILERAFDLDPFHVWHKNTLDLLDEMATFDSVSTGRFTIIASGDEITLLAATMGPLLEEAYDSLARRYQYQPPTPIRVEYFDRHADFSVRTIGLAGMGILGVSFGTTLAMDGLRARPAGEWNIGSTTWHELAHTFTLGKSDHRVPRWFSEGLSVLEERRAHDGWGASASVGFVAALAKDDLLPLEQLNDGFVRPDSPARLGLSYYQASLVTEYIEQHHGIEGIRTMLTDFGAGSTTEEVLQNVSGKGLDSLNADFTAWLQARFAIPLAAIGEQGGHLFEASMQAAASAVERGDTAAAVTALIAARDLFPEHAAANGPRFALAQLLWQRGDRQAALEEIATVTEADETALEANLMEMSWRLSVGDSARAAAALDRALWIAPADRDLWLQRASLAERAGEHLIRGEALRSVLALRPADPLKVRTDLAAALLASGNPEAARRELLMVLSQAPADERAQALLLEIHRAGAPQ